MSVDIATAYVQIKPTTKGIQSALTDEITGGASGAGSQFGGKFVKALKAAVVGAGIGSMISKALNEGGALQQSFGGLETIYGEAAEQAKEYAMAASEAGISANSFAEQAVSFGASLKQAYGGDMTKAVEAANTAILDMADNSAKMGTDISAIQTAYQGFAKQNYTMLDNLKLGYGGTKTEMQRLLKDAEKLSGVKYDINNLGDVYEAIHVIQEDLGLTGVAAAEASETFTGSMNAMKSAASNVLAGLALGMDISKPLQTLGNSVQAFLFNNLFPMIKNVMTQLPDLLSGIGGILVRALNVASMNTGEFIQVGVNLVTGLANAIITSLPYIIEAGVRLLMSLGTALATFDWVGTMMTVATSIATNFQIALQEIGVPSTLEGAASMVAGFVAGVVQRLPSILQSAIELIGRFAAGLISAIPRVVAAIPSIISAITNAFSGHNWLSIGSDIISGIARGITNGVGSIINAAKEAANSAFNAAKNALGINSPSKVMERGVGRWIPEGIALGITKNMKVVSTAMNDLVGLTDTSYIGQLSSGAYSANTLQTSHIGGAGGFNQNITINAPQQLSPSEVARQTRNATQQMALAMTGVL